MLLPPSSLGLVDTVEAEPKDSVPPLCEFLIVIGGGDGQTALQDIFALNLCKFFSVEDLFLVNFSLFSYPCVDSVEASWLGILIHLGLKLVGWGYWFIVGGGDGIHFNEIYVWCAYKAEQINMHLVYQDLF